MKSTISIFIIVVLQNFNGNIKATDEANQSVLDSWRSLFENFLSFYDKNVNKKIFRLFESEYLRNLIDYQSESDGDEEKILPSEGNSENVGTIELIKRIFVQPNLHLTTTELISFYGYPSESHEVVTEDGYILTLHRIPQNDKKSDPKKTILLYHGLLGSSADWVLMGPRRSLAFILSDYKYDVWMANGRGNKYSRDHLKRNVNSFAFWNFSWHDVSQYDLPAIISYITKAKKSKEKISYIGYSMGTTILFALLSTKPEYCQILKAGYALAPIAFMSDIRSPIKNLGNGFHGDKDIWQKLGVTEFSPPSDLINSIAREFCDTRYYDSSICEHVFFIFFGYDYKQISDVVLTKIKAYIPAGTSTKTILHYLQEIRNGGVFQQFDYGLRGNLKQYGAETPPIYQVSNITLPITLFSGENDWLASVSDVENLFQQLANPVEHYVVPYKDFSHLDFLFAKHAPRLVYRKLLEVLSSSL